MIFHASGIVAVSTVDAVGGILIAVGAALWLIVDGVRARYRPPHAVPGTAGLPDAPRQARPVEAGNIVAAGTSDRKDEAGCSSRPLPAAAAIEALTFPGPYSRVGVRK